MKIAKRVVDIGKDKLQLILQSKVVEILSTLAELSTVNGNKSSLVYEGALDHIYDHKTYNIKINISMEPIGFEMDKTLARDEFKVMLENLARFMEKYKITEEELLKTIEVLKKELNVAASDMDDYRQETGNGTGKND